MIRSGPAAGFGRRIAASYAALLLQHGWQLQPEGKFVLRIILQFLFLLEVIGSGRSSVRHKLQAFLHSARLECGNEAWAR